MNCFDCINLVRLENNHPYCKIYWDEIITENTAEEINCKEYQCEQY